MNQHPVLASFRRISPWGPYIVAAAVGCVALAGAFMAERLDQRETRAHAEAHLGEMARLQAERTDGFIDRIAQSLRFIGYLRERDELDFDLRALIDEGRLDGADVLQFGFVDAAGIVRQSSLPLGPVPVSVADRAHFRAVAVEGEAFHIGRPVLGRVSGRWSLQIVRAIRTERDGFLGAAMAAVDMAAFGGLLDLLGTEATIALVGADGVVRARTRREQGHLGETEIAHALAARLRAAESGLWEGPAPGTDGRHATLWRKLDAYPLYVTVTVPIRTLTADADRRAPYYWAAATCVALSGLLLAFAYARRRAHAEAKLAAAHAADAAKTRLLVSLNAELRRPVDMLRWSIDTLADSPDEAARRRALADLRRADAALGRAVNDAAELARLMRESKELDLRAIDARLLARDAFEAARGRAGGAGVTCDLALDLPEGLRILADENRLRRVADALLAAAVDRAGRDGRVGFSVGARGLDARNVEIAIAVSASGDPTRAPVPESGMLAALAQTMGGHVERLASPAGTLDVFKAGFARAG
jgi:two-component system, NarL family, sensor histidine kinase BarA